MRLAAASSSSSSSSSSTEDPIGQTGFVFVEGGDGDGDDGSGAAGKERKHQEKKMPNRNWRNVLSFERRKGKGKGLIGTKL
jgi:hypothetical protein